MSKERLLNQRLVRYVGAGLIGLAGALAHTHEVHAPAGLDQIPLSISGIAPEVPFAPSIEKPKRPEIPFEDYNLPPIVRESDTKIGDMKVLRLDVEDREPEEVLEVSEDTYVEKYHDVSRGEDAFSQIHAWGLRVKTPHDISVEVGHVVPIANGEGWGVNTILKLDQPRVELLKEAHGFVDIIIVDGLHKDYVNPFHVAILNAYPFYNSGLTADDSVRLWVELAFMKGEDRFSKKILLQRNQ